MIRSYPSPAPSPNSLGVKLGYALGNMGKSVIWASFESFMLFYLVAVLGMDPLIAGALLAATLVWDGLADVAVAWWTDRRGRSDMLTRLITVGAPMVALGFWAIFGLAPGPSRIITILAVIVCRLGYTLCDVGHNTLMVRVAAHPRDAATVSGLRLIFSAMGGALVGMATAQGLTGPLAAQRVALERSAALAAVLYLVTLLTAMHVSRRLPSSVQTNGGVDRPFRALSGNRAFIMVLVLMALQSGLTPLFTRALPFFGQAVHDDASWAGRALTVITLAQALSLPGWIALSRRYSSPDLLKASHGLLLIAMAGIGLGFPETFHLAALVVLGTAQGGMNMAIWAMLAQSLRGGGASEALPVGLFLAGIKCSAGLGNALFAGIVKLGDLQCGTCQAEHSPLLAALVAGIPAVGSVIIMALLGWQGRHWLDERPALRAMT